MSTRIKNILDSYIDYKAAFFGSLLLGSVVFFINYEHGAFLATTAASKQMLYTFFIAGLITRNNEKISLKFDQAIISISVAIIISSIIAVGLTFLVHNLKGTPKPLMSTLPTLILAPPSFLILALTARKNSSIEN
jgi:hypothetical protein